MLHSPLFTYLGTSSCSYICTVDNEYLCIHVHTHTHVHVHVYYVYVCVCGLREPLYVYDSIASPISISMYMYIHYEYINVHVHLLSMHFTPAQHVHLIHVIWTLLHIHTACCICVVCATSGWRVTWVLAVWLASSELESSCFLGWGWVACIFTVCILSPFHIHRHVVHVCNECILYVHVTGIFFRSCT